MNKTAIKNYAVWARNELIERVTRKAFEYGVEENHILDENLDNINGKLLTDDEKKQRKELIKEIKDKGFEHVIEEVAYTWFNRFIALRFMEANNYLPNRIRIFTDLNNEFNPQILDEAMNMELNGLDKELVFNLIESNNRDELYKQLLLATCNDMGNYLPGMFTIISDYKVLLFPDNLLNKESVLGRLVTDIDEDSWLDQVTIIGWLYQFYNEEPKAKVYARKKGTKIEKDQLPAVTQLFTPDWIVKYMVENSLGRLWQDGHPNENLKNGWKYYLTEAKQEESVINELNKIREEAKHKKIEDIKVIDPCMGSGHILVYAFDVLMQIYESEGWNQRDAAVSILKNNIYGLDIDERAYQLAYFALMMKARSYNRRIFTLDINPNVIDIREPEMISEDDALDRLGEFKELGLRLLSNFKDAKEYGSLIEISLSQDELNQLSNKLDEIYKMADYGTLIDQIESDELIRVFDILIKEAKILNNKYDITVTNPPYTPISNCDDILQKFVKDRYPDSKTDFCSIFIERCKELTKINGYQAMITMHSWMFLSSFEKLRSKLLKNITIVNMAHLGARAFEEIGGEVVQTTSFIFKNCLINDCIGSYKRLIDYNSQDAKENAYLSNNNLYFTSASNFSKIPGRPIAYWTSDRLLNAFNNLTLDKVANCCTGMQTGDNDKYVRAWYEIDYARTAMYSENKIYKRYNCGGEFRKWYGNHNNVVMWKNNGEAIRKEKSSVIRNEKFFFKKGLSWKRIGSSGIGLRFLPENFIFDQAGDSMFVDDENKLTYVLGFLNSKAAESCFSFIAPTMNLTAGNMNRLPFIYDDNRRLTIDNLVQINISISKSDWDSFETSWDFKEHPFIRWAKCLCDCTAIGATMDKYYGDLEPTSVNSPLELSYLLWQGECNERFNQLKENEEELNRIFIDIYSLQDELTPDVEDNDVTVRKADLTRDIKSFISYAVGCMFGRYSLDVEGLAYAGSEFDCNKYKSFIPDSDNIIPICDDEYFDDDIVGRFVKFVEVVYGKDSLEDNLRFIADVLGGKGTSREVIRNYFLNEFYKDHCKIYQKRPIYWLFDSGKKNGFKALVYLHRYQPDLIARMRTQYVFEQQSRYKNLINMIEKQVDGDISSSERVRLNKQLKSLKEQDEELRKYEEIVHHYADQMIPLDLDDGVKVNYEKFGELLAKIK